VSYDNSLDSIGQFRLICPTLTYDKSLDTVGHMADLIPEQVPVKDLPELLNVPRSRVYTLLDALEITPSKLGRSAYVEQADFLRLEALQSAIRSGSTIAEWLNTNPNPGSPPQEVALVSSLDTVGQMPEASPGLVLSAVERILTQVLPPAKPSLKEKLETLALAAREGLSLSNTELAELLNLSPKTLSRRTKFHANGLTFSKTKEGGSIYWRIDKHV
jgi:hypothetical protein